MKSRVLLAFLSLAAVTFVLARAQESSQPKKTDPKGSQVADDAALKERILARQFAEFEQSLLKLKQRLERSPKREDQERAKILQKALDECRARGLGAQFDPMFQAILSCTWAGWTCDEEIQKVGQELARETDAKKRRALWEQQTRLWYDKVPSIRLGDLHGLRATQKIVKGLNENTERPRFYNVWLDK